MYSCMLCICVVSFPACGKCIQQAGQLVNTCRKKKRNVRVRNKFVFELTSRVRTAARAVRHCTKNPAAPRRPRAKASRKGRAGGNSGWRPKCTCTYTWSQVSSPWLGNMHLAETAKFLVMDFSTRLSRVLYLRRVCTRSNESTWRGRVAKRGNHHTPVAWRTTIFWLILHQRLLL